MLRVDVLPVLHIHGDVANKTVCRTLPISNCPPSHVANVEKNIAKRPPSHSQMLHRKLQDEYAQGVDLDI